MFGIGVDLTYIPEFRKALDDKSTSFFHKYYTKNEINYANQISHFPSDYYSSRYAAKEAFIKALDGNRLFEESAIKIDYTEIEIQKDNYGRPYFCFYGNLKEYIIQRQIKKVSVSLSHVKDYSIAQVLIEY